MNENQEKLAILVAETILANTKLLQALVDTLPKSVADVVVKTVAKETKVTPVKPVVQEVVAPAVVVEPTKPVEVTPAPAVVVEQVVAPVTTPVTSEKAPFIDQAGLTKFVMKRYTELGPIKGAAIQECLNKIGAKNINDIPAAKYDELFALVSALS